MPHLSFIHCSPPTTRSEPAAGLRWALRVLLVVLALVALPQSSAADPPTSTGPDVTGPVAPGTTLAQPRSSPTTEPWVAVDELDKIRRLERRRYRRRFPIGWCPLENPLGSPVYFEFEATAPTATLRLEADSVNRFGAWNAFRLDSVVVLESDEYFRHLRLDSNCYQDDVGNEPNPVTGPPGAPYLDWRAVDRSAIVFEDFFVSGFSNRWSGVGLATTSEGLDSDSPVFWFAGDTAPQPELSVPPISRNGALGLGRNLLGERPAQLSLALDRLVPGRSYVVTAWWHALEGSLDGDPDDTERVGLTIDLEVPDVTEVILRDRFRVRVDWRDFNGNTGSAKAASAGTDDSGIFWFFDADNWELLVKVLDGCGLNGHYWIFAAATTNVQYTLVVEDLLRGSSVVYFNPLGVASPAVTDTSALATCP
ncbi:MAG: hypothetical protein AAGC60_27590 [Acidobacteriota bacterium]